MARSTTTAYLPEIAQPGDDPMGLDKPYWDGLNQDKLLVQKCKACGKFQWGPEWICHRCLSYDLTYETVEPRAKIYSWMRIWHPVHPGVKDSLPYLAITVELPQADGIRMAGNLLGDANQSVKIGADVTAVFEHHAAATPPYTLLQWEVAK